MSLAVVRIALLAIAATVVIIASPVSANDRDKCDLNDSLDDGIAACTRVINRKVGTADERAFYYSQRGSRFADKNEFDRAISDFTYAISLKADKNSTAYYYAQRSSAFRHKRDYDRAISDATEAIKLSPKLAFAFSVRGDSLHRKGENLDAALADLNDAIRFDPSIVSSYSYRGALFVTRGDLARAREDFNKGLSLPRDNWDNLNIHQTLKAQVAGLPPEVRPAAATPSPAPSSTALVKLQEAVKPQNSDRRVALVIGNSAYRSVPVLPNPRSDAAAIAESLRKVGFQTVTLQSDLGREALVNALRDFAQVAEKADWAVVYYAGHGIEVGGINYLVPIDAKLSSDRDVGFEAVALDQVLNAAERAGKLRLIVLDACRDNPFASQMKRSLTVASRSVSRGLAQVEPDAGTLVVYAAKHGETALDGEGGNSPFAQALIRNMQMPGVEVRRLFDNVRDDVLELTKRRQQPFSYGSISGRQDFYFVAGK